MMPYYHNEAHKSIGNSVTFSRDLVGSEDWKTAVVALSDKVSSRLRKTGILAGGMRLEIKDSGFQTISRQRNFPYPVSNANDLASMALSILKKEWTADKPIRLLQLTAIHLTYPVPEEQLTLFPDSDTNREKAEKVGETIDKIRNKYGDRAISFGRTLHNDIGLHEHTDDPKDEDL